MLLKNKKGQQTCRFHAARGLDASIARSFALKLIEKEQWKKREANG